MPEGSIQSFSSYAETDRSRLSCTPICYHKQKGRDLLQNKVGPHSDLLEKNLVCLAQYRSKYTNRKTVDQRKSNFTKQEDTFRQMLLMTPVILFTPSLQLACWCPRGTWCHPDPSVSLPLSALSPLSELEELASISSWLLGAE